MTTVAHEILSYPMGEEVRLDVDPFYRELQAQVPIKVQLPYGEPCWLATRYDDVRMVYGDRRFSRAAGLTHDAPGLFSSAHVKSPTMLVNMDPPAHTRLRRLTSGPFSPKRVALMAPWIQGLVDELLDDLEGGRGTDLEGNGPGVDFVAMVAEQLPVKVLVGILGVDGADATRFRAWVDTMSMADASSEQKGAARDELYAYIRGLIAARRVERTDDLLSVLVEARDDDDRLDEEELLELCLTLWSGGFKTTLMQLGLTVFTLMTQRDRWDELVETPELVPTAAEELWRWIPAFRYGRPFCRWATEDLELPSGLLVRAGEPVLPEHVVANRDESVYEHGWELDFHRANPRPHLALAFGPHHCMGAHLAVLQVRLTLETLVRRFPTLRLAIPADDVPWSMKAVMRAVVRLPVAW